MIWKKMKKHEMRRLMFMLLLTGERRNAKNQKKMIMTMAMIVEYCGNLRTHTQRPVPLGAKHSPNFRTQS